VWNRRPITNTLTAVFSGLLLFAASTNASAQPAWHTQVGYAQLLNEYGLVADGSGLDVALVEALSGGNFMPDPAQPDLSGKAINQGSPGSSDPSGHATGVALNFFGNTNSISPGVAQITGFDANDWLGNQLGFDLGTDPLPQNFAVSNHSYIGFGLSVSDATDLLQRLDFAVNQTGMVAVVGVPNSGSLSQLLAPAYNVISVGRSSGVHASGLTTFYGAGRVKPEIVVPSSSTSEGTARVSSGASLIYNAAGGGNGSRPQVVKALLLAGATKSEFPTWDRTTTRPLDEVYGAGEMNVYHSYRILAGGEFDGTLGAAPSTLAPHEAWDFATASSESAMYYDLNVPIAAKDISIVLTWNMEITDTDEGEDFSPVASLGDNLDLRLYSVGGPFPGMLLDSSVSTVGNVEHIYVSSLGAGLYRMEVQSNVARDFALAWRLTAIPEPSFCWALIAVALFGAVWSRRQKPQNPCCGRA
jgi:hypothetical protein